MKIDPEMKLDFCDVLLKPKRSKIESRKDVCLEREFTFLHSPLKLTGIVPIISSNMTSVTNEIVAKKMAEHHMLACMPKTLEYTPSDWTIQSIGLQDKPNPQATWICLDVPTAYLDVVVERTKELRSMCPESILIVGNVVTPKQTKKLLKNGADIIKIGLGSGVACKTRLVAGVGIPQISAIIECSKAAHSVGGMIISDGGCQVPGDLAKAFGAGADFVMLGGMLAGHENENGTDFYGMSSERANNEFAGGLKDYRASEGWEMKLENRGPIDATLQDIEGGLRSACSYVGARTIEELPKKSTFIRVNRQDNQSLWDYRI